MTGQTSLFDAPAPTGTAVDLSERAAAIARSADRRRVAQPARPTDPGTSWAAARSLDPVKVGEQVARAVEVVAAAACEGATCADVVAATGADRGCTARRLTDARDAGLIVDSGQRRRAPSGRWQVVWIAPDVCPEVAA